ncbi:MAG: hypothetical protein SAL70_39510 [Scytonema sp. PMC 1070.18]|nr:hypothetical protein [Scytonema sp. PMC 1070.18]
MDRDSTKELPGCLMVQKRSGFLALMNNGRVAIACLMKLSLSQK